MNRHFNLIILGALVFAIVSCGGAEKETGKKGKEVEKPSETSEMVKRLRDLVNYGEATENYHWNYKLSQIHKSNLKKGTPQQQMNTWFQYCLETLNAGDYNTAILELEGNLAQSGQPYEELLSDGNRLIFELLALSYLRMGEQENCQENHTAESCILPLQENGQHSIRLGSSKAAYLYSLLYDKYETDKYKWLLNLAAMTLGDHPDALKPHHRIKFPNWSIEQKNFPRFEEIAMYVGLAEDGLSGGTCVDDFNNDGYLDVFATSYGMEDQVQVFLNDKNGGFKDYTIESGLKGIVSGLNCIHADYNNDGNMDIFILRGAWLGKGGDHPNSLLKGNGDGTFVDVTSSAGLLTYHPTQTADWADFNQDGYLDLFIGNESDNEQAHACELYQNNGDGTFTEVSKDVGIGQLTEFVKGVVWGDINNDQYPDLYISVLGGKNKLFLNNQGTFTDISATSNVEEPNYSFPCWFWDVNNDGFEDLFVASYDLNNLRDLAEFYAAEMQGKKIECELPKLYLNNGDNTFTDITSRAKLQRSMHAMGANFGDLDNDGYLDFYVGTGAPDFSTVVPNRMFRNVNGKKFEEVTSAGNFGHIQKGHGVAWADLDRDGDQDIYCVMGGAFEGDNFTNILYENPINDNNWIVIELEGSEMNKSAIGARIEVKTNKGKTFFRTVGTGGSFGASSVQQEIGLGKADKITTLKIIWGKFGEQVFEDVEVNQKIVIKQGSEIESVTYEKVPFSKEEMVHHH